jgi:hypothetical protein
MHPGVGLGLGIRSPGNGVDGDSSRNHPSGEVLRIIIQLQWIVIRLQRSLSIQEHQQLT